MLVLCNGMPRSGSTWSFNVVMGLLRRACGPDAVYGGYDEGLMRFLNAAPARAAHLVLKCHSLTGAARALARVGAARVVYTWRDPADAVVSSQRMFGYGFDEAFELIAASLRCYRFHLETGNCVILPYREVGTAAGAGRIACYLGLDSGAAEAVAVETRIASMRERSPSAAALDGPHDPETLLHPGHIRDGSTGYGRGALAPGELARIDALAREHGLLA